MESSCGVIQKYFYQTSFKTPRFWRAEPGPGEETFRLDGTVREIADPKRRVAVLPEYERLAGENTALSVRVRSTSHFPI
jgi:hypothetical protein